jgi:hypothetical protein
MRAGGRPGVGPSNTAHRVSDGVDGAARGDPADGERSACACRPACKRRYAEAASELLAGLGSLLAIACVEGQVWKAPGALLRNLRCLPLTYRLA